MRDLVGMVVLAVALAGCGGVSFSGTDGGEISGGCAGECSGAECDALPSVEWSEDGGGRLILRGEGMSGVTMKAAPKDQARRVTAWSCPPASYTRNGDTWTLLLGEPLERGDSLEIVLNEWSSAGSVLPVRPYEVEPF